MPTLAHKPNLYIQVMMQVAAWRAQIRSFLTQLPFYPELERLSLIFSGPVKAISRRTLELFPSLRRAEWLLEIETLTQRHPIGLAFSVCYTAYLGLTPSMFGHIATNVSLYPFLGVVSGFNPFLGILCGVSYGIADFVQKLLYNDIYGTHGYQKIGPDIGPGALDYWGAMAGYIVAYSTTMIMGVLPGVTSRLSRYSMRVALQTLMYRRAAASADGAKPPFHLNFKDSKLIGVVQQLQQDPRDLLADPNAWRSAEGLTPYQKLVLAQLRAQGLLGPDSAEKLNKLWGVSPSGDSEGESSGSSGADPGANPPDDLSLEPNDFGPNDLGATTGEFVGIRQPPGSVPSTPAGQSVAPPCVTAGSLPGTAGVPPEGMPLAASQAVHPLLEAIAAMVGGFIGGAATMYAIAPTTESLPFYSRPHVDDSCHKLEVNTYLKGKAPLGGLAGAVGGLGTDVTPPQGAPGRKPPARPSPKSTPPSPQPAGPSQQEIDNLLGVNWESLRGHPELQQQYQALIDQYNKNRTIDTTAWNQFQRNLSDSDATYRGQWDAGTQQALARSQQLESQRDTARDAQFERQKDLSDQYQGLLNRASTQNLYGPGETLISGIDVHNPDGSINEAKLKALSDAVGEAAQTARDAAQQQRDMNQAIAAQERQNANDWNDWAERAKKLRNAAIAVEGALLTGGVGGMAATAAGGGVAGSLAAGLAGGTAGVGYGAFTAGATVLNDGGSWDDAKKGAYQGLKAGSLGGLAGGAIGGVLHLGTAALGLSQAAATLGGQVVSGALAGGLTAKATGGDFTTGALEGAVLGPMAGWAGSVTGGTPGKPGGWNKPVFGTGNVDTPTFVPPEIDAAAPPPGAVDGPGTSARGSNWNRQPVTPEARPGPSVPKDGPRVFTSPSGTNWRVAAPSPEGPQIPPLNPAGPVVAPSDSSSQTPSKPPGALPGDFPPTGNWNRPPAPPEAPSVPSIPKDGPRVATNEAGNNWGTNPAPRGGPQVPPLTPMGDQPVIPQSEGSGQTPTPRRALPGDFPPGGNWNRPRVTPEPPLTPALPKDGPRVGTSEAGPNWGAKPPRWTEPEVPSQSPAGIGGETVGKTSPGPRVVRPEPDPAGVGGETVGKTSPGPRVVPPETDPAGVGGETVGKTSPGPRVVRPEPDPAGVGGETVGKTSPGPRVVRPEPDPAGIGGETVGKTSPGPRVVRPEPDPAGVGGETVGKTSPGPRVVPPETDPAGGGGETAGKTSPPRLEAAGAEGNIKTTLEALDRRLNALNPNDPQYEAKRALIQDAIGRVKAQAPQPPPSPSDVNVHQALDDPGGYTGKPARFKPPTPPPPSKEPAPPAAMPNVPDHLLPPELQTKPGDPPPAAQTTNLQGNSTEPSPKVQPWQWRYPKNPYGKPGTKVNLGDRGIPQGPAVQANNFPPVDPDGTPYDPSKFPWNKHLVDPPETQPADARYPRDPVTGQVIGDHGPPPDTPASGPYDPNELPWNKHGQRPPVGYEGPGDPAVAREAARPTSDLKRDLTIANMEGDTQKAALIQKALNRQQGISEPPAPTTAPVPEPDPATVAELQKLPRKDLESQLLTAQIEGNTDRAKTLQAALDGHPEPPGPTVNPPTRGEISQELKNESLEALQNSRDAALRHGDPEHAKIYQDAIDERLKSLNRPNAAPPVQTSPEPQPTAPSAPAPEHPQTAAPAPGSHEHNVEAAHPTQHLAEIPGLDGEHADHNLGGNPNNPTGAIPNEPYTTNSGKVIKDPFEAALARHAEAKPADTPFKSYTSNYNKAAEFNSGEVAQVDIPESQIRQMMANKAAGKVPYAKMGNTDYLTEQEMCIKNVPSENWRIVTSKPSGPKMMQDSQGPLAGFDYYLNSKGERVYRFYRGLGRND